MKYVVCDEDVLLRSMIETILERKGHEVVGVADNTALATQLVRAGRPEAVIVDLSLGYNTDFDIIDAAMAVGARVIIFSHYADHEVLSRYSPRPVVVAKPDLVELERVIVASDTGDGGSPVKERRRRPARSAVGPTPSGVGDAQAFYEALGNAGEGDALLSLESAGDGGGPELAESAANRVAALIRASDRVLAAASSVKVFLAGGGTPGVDAFVRRLGEQVPDLAEAVAVRSIVIGPDESSADAFTRLKTSGSVRPVAVVEHERG